MTGHHDERYLASLVPFQHGYVTNDVERAARHFRDELGVPEFAIMDWTMSPLTREGRVDIPGRLGFAFVGELMLELIEPASDPSGVYAAVLPASGFGLTLHHFGYRLRPEIEWDEFRALPGPEVLLEGRGDPSYLYLDSRPTLGHCLEYLQFSPERLAGLRASTPGG